MRFRIAIILILLIISAHARNMHQNIQDQNQTKGAAVKKSFKPNEQIEGDSASLTRIIGISISIQLILHAWFSIGGKDLKQFDPFLLLDFFKIKLPAGFPDHPHRGYETVTYMIDGTFHNEDFHGHKGVLNKGDVQWMTAGKGIVHAEMPGSYEKESIGFQLWVMLPSHLQMIDPNYQEFQSNQIPEVKKKGMKVRVISGTFQEENVKGAAETKTEIKFLDVHLSQDIQFKELIDLEITCMLYVYQGKIKIQDKEYEKGEAIEFQPLRSGSIDYAIIYSASKLAKFIFLCSKPTKEICYQRETFIGSSFVQLDQNMRDHQNAQNGFEGADKWESEIRHLPRILLKSDL